MTKAELLTLIRDQDASPVVRGEAIVTVCNDYGMSLQILARRETSLSDTMISRLKKCYENLSEDARRICKDIDIDVEACHKLGSRISRPDQKSVIVLAIEIGKKREGKRPIQKMGPQGRRSLRGRITNQDMLDAIRDFNDTPHML